MPAYLLFQLYGPLQSYGGVSPGELRSSQGHPSKSAVLGLLAGALGIERDQERRLADLSQGYWLAVRQDVPGTPLLDYHTAQTRPGKRGRFASRGHELSQGLKPGESPTTILSTRQYLQDALFTACLRGVEGKAPYSLDALAQALERPVFAPYLGRKSCPPGLPFAARVVEAGNLAGAFAGYGAPDAAVRRLLGGNRVESVRYFWEDPEEPGRGQHVTRRDELLSRGRWQYRDRKEWEGNLEPVSQEGS